MGLAAVPQSGGGSGSGWTTRNVAIFLAMFGAAYGVPYFYGSTDYVPEAPWCLVYAEGEYVDSSYTVGTKTVYYSVVTSLRSYHAVIDHGILESGNPSVTAPDWSTDNNGFYLGEATHVTPTGPPCVTPSFNSPATAGPPDSATFALVMEGTAWNLRTTPSGD